MCEATIWLTVLFCFYLLQFICSCETLYKNKVWGQTMGAFPVSPCQGFNFHTIKCFHQWPSAHSFSSQTYPRSYCWGWGVGCPCTARMETDTDREGGGGGVPQPPGLSLQTCGLKLLKSRRARLSHHLPAIPSSGPPSVKGERLSWGLVWPRSPGGQAFPQLLTQSCPASHPQNPSTPSLLSCKCAMHIGFFSVFGS